MPLEETTATTLEQAVPAQRLVAYVVSDVHLNTNTHEEHLYNENQERIHFRQFLTRLRRQAADTPDRILLILNGDILDINGSWKASVFPWSADKAAVEQALLQLLEAITQNNCHIFAELKALLTHPTVEVVYVFGNHDRLLESFPTAQTFLRESLCATDEASLRFGFQRFFESLELGLYTEHGHRFDPFNHRTAQQDIPFGEVINILIANRFVHLVLHRLKTLGFSEDVLVRLQDELEDIDALRPLTLGPYWLEALANRYREHPENEGKPESIDQIIYGVMAETLLNPEVVRLVAKRFFLSKVLVRALFRIISGAPNVLPRLSFVITLMLHKTRSNRYQIRMAQTIQEDQGFRFITFGHTHLPGLTPLTHNGFFFNTGCWKPVINLFLPPSRPPQVLDYLYPTMPFVRVERSAILRIEKDLRHPDQPVRFSLETLQQGAE